MKEIDILNTIADIIHSKKGYNILCLEVKKNSSMTDYIIICEGHIERHIKSISDEIEKKLKNIKVTPLHIDGNINSPWIVLDYLNILIHIFRPETRREYKIEELYKDAKIVNVKIKERKRHD